MEIMDFYKSLLGSVGCAVLENAEVHEQYFGELTPIRVSGKQLVLPTAEILKQGNWDGRVAFHPVCESAMRSESPVFKELRRLMTTRASNVIADLLVQLMSIAADKTIHPRLTPDQAEYLTKLPDGINETTSSKLVSVINATSPKSEHRLITMFPKRAGKLDGVEYRRLAVVEFPIMQAKQSEELRIFGVAMGTKRDKNAILKLFEYLLPDADTKEYCAGSQDLSAPGFLALCLSYGKVMSRLNHVVNLFQDLLEDGAELVTEMGWYDGLDKIERYRAAIPVLSGNDGDPVVDNPGVIQTVGPSTAPIPVVNPQPLAAPVPLPAVQPAAENTMMKRPEHKLGFADIIAPIDSKGVGSKPVKQEQGLVYKEEPVVVNRYGQVVAGSQAPTFTSAPVYPQQQPQAYGQVPLNYPANSGYVPVAAGNTFQQVPVQQPVPQFMAAPPNVVQQLPVPAGFGLAIEVATGQPVVFGPNQQPLGYYQQVMPQIMASLQPPQQQFAQQQFVQQPAYQQQQFVQQPAYAAPMNTRQAATLALQQRDMMTAQRYPQNNQQTFAPGQPVWNNAPGFYR